MKVLIEKSWDECGEFQCICEMEIPEGEGFYKGIEGDICARRMVLKKEMRLDKLGYLKMMLRSWQNTISDYANCYCEGMINKLKREVITVLEGMIKDEEKKIGE